MSCDSLPIVLDLQTREHQLPETPTLDDFNAAIAQVAERTMSLSSAITELAFAKGARLRDELGHALHHAELLVAHLADSAERAIAVRRLGEMRGVVFRLFQLAPAPSPAAITAAETGDLSLLTGEEQAWISARLAQGTNPRLPAPQRARSPTIPGTPLALRLASGVQYDAGTSSIETCAADSAAAEAAPALDDRDRSPSPNQVVDDESI